MKDNVSVEYPNPEEGASSLDLAFRTAEASGARYLSLSQEPGRQLSRIVKRETAMLSRARCSLVDALER